MTLEQTFGRYRLLERLGEGGMAEVFKAKSFGVEGFEKVLVIKRILPKLAEHPQFVDMFVHEAKLAVRLSHANIVQVFDLGRVDHPNGDPTSYFIAMEYVPGIDLATLLARCRRQKIQVPFGMAVFITAEVAKALDHAHRRRDEQSRPLGIVHRDISPQNILLSWEGEVKVTDFGIAKAKDSIIDEAADRSAGRVRGKLAYMSPEQAMALSLDGRSDLFSLGAVLYEMIGGTNPFAANTAQETLRRVVAGEFPPIELVRADTPKGLIDISNKLLSKGRDDRFADAGKLHEHLLGYFYASGERFGSHKLAELMERFREDRGSPEIEAARVFEDRAGADERTPVEVPSPTSQERPRPTTSAILRLTSEGDSLQITRTADIGERRDVTALVLAIAQEPRGRRSEHALARGSTPPPPSIQTIEPGANDRPPDSIRRADPVYRARDVLARYGARIIEDEPDQIVAIFGTDDADGRDTEAAVRAALLIVRGGAISAGIHVSRILVDGQGTPIKDGRLSSLVATAQTLARATEGQVAASRIAARIVRTEFTSDDLPAAGPLAGAPEGGRLITGAQSPSAVYGRFVGRSTELKRLGDILASATRRRAQIVTIFGDKGIGKTRMVAEMERRLAKGNYNVGFYIASCSKNGAEIAWSGISTMLRVLCGVQEGDDEARILEVVPRLRALGLHSDESNAVLTQLGAAPRGGSSGDLGAALRAAFTRMVQSLCDDRLHVFCWDDAQAMDASTLDVIASIAGREKARGDSIAPTSGGGLRAVFVLASRDEPPELLATHPLHHRVALGELGDDDSARLISTRVGARVLAPELLEFCRERAGGHPLFLEELIKELTDSGAISVMNGAVRARLEGATAVPRTLRTLIAGRVSRLDPNERAVLQAAAILGDPIHTSVVGALLKHSVSQIDRLVASLFARDFLRITGPDQVSFASPMHGEIVLDTIPPEARRELHSAAAAAFLAVEGEEGVEHAERIGHHLYEAGDRDRAAGFFASAALHEMKVGRVEPSIRLLFRALDLADTERRSAEELGVWLTALADAVTRVRASPDLAGVAARVIRRIDAAGELSERIRARVNVARALGAVNLFEAAYRELDEAFALADGDKYLLSAALVAEIETAGRKGDFARALPAVERLESLGGLTTSRALLAMSYVRATTGDLTGALRAIDEAERLDPPEDIVAAAEREKQRVLALINAQDYKAAVDASVRAVDLARATGIRYAAAVALHNLGDASRRHGDLPRAYAALSESRELAEAGGQERLVTLNRIHLAYLDGIGGMPDAESLLRDLCRYAESRGYFTDAREGRFLLGALLAHTGSSDDARRAFEGVLAMALEQGDQSVVAEARAALAKLDDG